jgi:ribosomal protein L33
MIIKAKVVMIRIVFSCFFCFSLFYLTNINKKNNLSNK